MADHPNAAKLRAAAEALEASGDMSSQMGMIVRHPGRPELA